MQNFVKLLINVCIIHLAVFSSWVNAQTRIVGGRPVNIEEFPYQLSLMIDKKPICGAALISSDKALSAAHCIIRPGLYSVRAGSAFVNKGGVVEYVRRIRLHPRYKTKGVDYDLSILELVKPLSLSRFIQPVNLPELDAKIYPGTMGTVSGWGSVSSLFDLPVSQLRAVQVPVMPTSWCIFSYMTDILTSRMFCAGLSQGGKDSCQGDSGGPFVVNDTLYGIVSWGENCAQPGYPGVYTNILALREYIRFNTDV